jgi:uncharacterized damage-inducible protein DinB
MKAYRNGAIGALMDEYERSTIDFKLLLQHTTEDQFIQILDSQTKDEECRSVQTIVSHVVHSGYAYADYIRAYFHMPLASPARELLPYTKAAHQLTAMLRYTAHTLEEKWNMTEEQIMAVSIDTRWGVKYDLEQLLEHAIVHVLRHRRQIERLRDERIEI